MFHRNDWINAGIPTGWNIRRQSFKMIPQKYIYWHEKFHSKWLKVVPYPFKNNFISTYHRTLSRRTYLPILMVAGTVVSSFLSTGLPVLPNFISFVCTIKVTIESIAITTHISWTPQRGWTKGRSTSFQMVLNRSCYYRLKPALLRPSAAPLPPP